MEIKTIINEIKQELQAKVDTEGQNRKVDIRKIIKNNNVCLTGVCIMQAHCQVPVMSPTIYIDDMIQDCVEGIRSVTSVVEEIYQIDTNTKNPDVSIDNLFDKEFVLNNTICYIVNREQNKELLSGVPYKDFLDLAVIYRIILNEAEDGISSTIVTNELLDRTGINQKELQAAAINNICNAGFEVINLLQLMAERYGMPVPDPGENEIPMFVMSNSKRMYGSAVMLCNSYLKEAASAIGEEKIILIPSSIHEIIAISASLDIEDVKTMVKEVNSTELRPEEILSDNVYLYDSSCNKLTLL